MSVEMQQPMTDAAPRRRRVTKWQLVIAATVLIAGCIGGYLLRSRDTAVSAAPGAVTAQVLEDRYGARVDLVGLTAVGGLLELRFTVLDKDKADPLFHDEKPNLLLEASGTVLTPPVDRAHKMVLLNGASYFMLYANAGNVAHTGDKVSVVMGDIRLEHLTIKS
jgi:hypothetical protein